MASPSTHNAHKPPFANRVKRFLLVTIIFLHLGLGDDRSHEGSLGEPWGCGEEKRGENTRTRVARTMPSAKCDRNRGCELLTVTIARNAWEGHWLAWAKDEAIWPKHFEGNRRSFVGLLAGSNETRTNENILALTHLAIRLFHSDGLTR